MISCECEMIVDTQHDAPGEDASCDALFLKNHPVVDSFLHHHDHDHMYKPTCLPPKPLKLKPTEVHSLFYLHCLSGIHKKCLLRIQERL